MLRGVGRGRTIYAFLFPSFTYFQSPDQPRRKLDNESEPKPTLSPGEIGMDRVISALRLTEEGTLSPYVRSLMTLVGTSWFCGFFIGGMRHTQDIPQTFMAENQATKFQNQFDAQRQLQTKFTREFIRAGAKFGSRLAFFCFMFGATSNFLNVFRAKTEVKNYSFAGALTGSMCRTHLGVRAMFSGAVVGTALGSMCGSLAILMLYFTGYSINDVYETHSNWIEARRQKILQNEREAAMNEEPTAMGLLEKESIEVNTKQDQIQMSKTN